MYKRCINSGDVLAFNRLIIHTCVRCGYYSLYDFCQGARSSAYVNEHLIMSPCSFDTKIEIDNDLHFYSINHIFNESLQFKKRNKEINDKKASTQYFMNHTDEIRV